MRRRALLTAGAGKKMELYLTTTNSQSSDYLFNLNFRGPGVFVIRDLDGNEIMRQKKIPSIYVRFDFSGMTGVRRIFLEINEHQLKGIVSTNASNQGTDVFEFPLDPRLVNILQFAYRGSNSSISLPGIDGIPSTWLKLRTFIVFGSVNDMFLTLPENLPLLETLMIGSSDHPGFNNLSTIPFYENLKEVAIHGNNTISDISSLVNVTSVSIHGNNTISDISSLVNATSVSIHGNNTISDISSLVNATSVSIHGNNTISDISSLVNVTSVSIHGNNTISDVSSLVNATSVSIHGNNTISDVSSLVNATSVSIHGNNTISLELSSGFELIRNLFLRTSSGFLDISYTNRKVWASDMQRVNLRPTTGGLCTSGNQVANLIIDLSKSTWATGSSTYMVDIRGNALPPTPSPELTDALTYFANIGIPVYTN